MDARQLFLMNHAHTHALIGLPGVTTGREQRLYEGLSDADLRSCPFDRHNSIAWLLWHMARCEDVMVNTVLRNEPEVVDNGWFNRLGVETRHIGTGDTMEEVNTFSHRSTVAALRRYRAAVAQATRDWVEVVDFNSLDGVLKRAAAERAAERGAFGPRADWVRVRWGDETGSQIFWLCWLGFGRFGHNHSHLGEGSVTRGLIEAART
jgi:hypothetical protein